MYSFILGMNVWCTLLVGRIPIPTESGRGYSSTMSAPRFLQNTGGTFL